MAIRFNGWPGGCSRRFISQAVCRLSHWTRGESNSSLSHNESHVLQLYGLRKKKLPQPKTFLPLEVRNQAPWFVHESLANVSSIALTSQLSKIHGPWSKTNFVWNSPSNSVFTKMIRYKHIHDGTVFAFRSDSLSFTTCWNRFHHFQYGHCTCAWDAPKYSKKEKWR